MRHQIARLVQYRIVVPFLLGILIGVGFGSPLRTLYWTTILDRHPNNWIKLKAGSRLAENEAGIWALRERVTSTDKAVRVTALSQLAWAEKPWQLRSLFGEISDTYVDEKLELLHGLDYAEQHHLVLAALASEYENATNPSFKAATKTILQSFDDVARKTRERVPE